MANHILKGFSNYSVSKDGYIENITYTVPKRMGIFDNGQGYKYSTLIGDDGKPHNVYLHRAVAEVYIMEDLNGYQVNHIDGNRANNKESNLMVMLPWEHKMWHSAVNKVAKELDYYVEDGIYYTWDRNFKGRTPQELYWVFLWFLMAFNNISVNGKPYVIGNILDKKIVSAQPNWLIGTVRRKSR